MRPTAPSARLHTPALYRPRLPQPNLAMTLTRKLRLRHRAESPQSRLLQFRSWNQKTSIRFNTRLFTIAQRSEAPYPRLMLCVVKMEQTWGRQE